MRKSYKSYLHTFSTFSILLLFFLLYQFRFMFAVRDKLPVFLSHYFIYIFFVLCLRIMRSSLFVNLLHSTNFIRSRYFCVEKSRISDSFQRLTPVLAVWRLCLCSADARLPPRLREGVGGCKSDAAVPCLFVSVSVSLLLCPLFEASFYLSTYISNTSK